MGKRRKVKKIKSFEGLHEIAVEQRFFDKPLKLKEPENPPNYARFEEKTQEEPVKKSRFFWPFR